MDYGSFAHHTLTFDVAQAAPRVLVEMAGGRLAVRIDPDEAHGSTSLVGTMEDLHRFASAIHAALIAHETGTHPIGAAAREVGGDGWNNRACPGCQTLRNHDFRYCSDCDLATEPVLSGPFQRVR